MLPRNRTGYSFHFAFGRLEKSMEALVKMGAKYAPITDRDSTFGFVTWRKLCEKNGLKPVYGVELAVSPDLSAKRPRLDYWTFLAKDKLEPLHELIYQATSRSKAPALSYDAALAASTQLNVIAGETSVLELITKPIHLALSPSLPMAQLSIARKKRLKLCAVPDNSYPTPGDATAYSVALGRRARMASYDQHLLSEKEWTAAVPFATDAERKAALASARTMLKQCTATLRTAELVVPDKPKSLRAMCLDGAKRLGVKMNAVYKSRMEYELKLIEEKNFGDYFYIIADIMAYANRHMLVGPARGSSCGSLVCFLLGITTVDPIPFGLIFERFIDINRNDLPDIDIDFSDARRDLVFEYIREKYGREHVARLGSVGVFKPRSAIKAAAAAFGVPDYRVDPVLDVMIKRSSADSRAMNVVEDTFTQTDSGKALIAEYPELAIAQLIEGAPSMSSQHAAGVVITRDPITNFVAVNAQTEAAMCSKYDAEALNMLKIDALGLTQLSGFERCLELIGEKQSIEYFRKLPLDDKAAFKVLNDHRFSGVFQYEGIILQNITSMITVKSLDDIVAITALARPGPIATGGSMAWVERHNGTKPVEYPHPLFEPYLRDTLGVVTYQEQVMNIGRNIGDLSWEDVTLLRKAMSRSLGKEYFNQFGDRWKAAARRKNIPDTTLDKVWDDLCAYGAWAFNKAHAVAYGLVSYYCCYLKAHFPVEYAAAMLDAEKDPMKQIEMLREMQRIGVNYIPVDGGKSTGRWVIERHKGKQTLVGPLQQIKGIGEAATREIVAMRNEGKEVRPALAKRLTDPKTKIDSLTPVFDAASAVAPDLVARQNYTQAGTVKMGMGGGDKVVIGVATKIAPRDRNDLQSVAKRGGKRIKGPSIALNIFIRDDTGEVLCIINPRLYGKLGKVVLENGKAKKSLFAFRGPVPRDFRMIDVQAVKYLGDLE